MRLVRRRICLQSPPDSTVGVGPKTILVQLEAPELHQNEILVQLDRPGVEKKLPSCTKIPVDPIAEILPWGNQARLKGEAWQASGVASRKIPFPHG